MKKIKRRKFTLKKVGKLLLRNLIALIVGLVYLVVITIKAINKFVAKMFKKLPSYLKAGLIYALILGNVPNFVAVYDLVKDTKIENVEIVDSVVALVQEETIEETEKVEEIVEEKITCNLTEIECKIFNKALENAMSEEQAYLLVAISKHETGNWTSQLFKESNNFGGLYNSSKGKFYSYSTQEEGLNAFVNLLKNRYFGKGLNTIEKIGNVYCPVGASNDPKGVNQYWIPKVTQYYNQYLENVK